MVKGDASHGQGAQSMVLGRLLQALLVARQVKVPDIRHRSRVRRIQEIARDFVGEFLAPGAGKHEEDGWEAPARVQVLEALIQLVLKRLGSRLPTHRTRFPTPQAFKPSLFHLIHLFLELVMGQ